MPPKAVYYALAQAERTLLGGRRDPARGRFAEPCGHARVIVVVGVAVTALAVLRRAARNKRTGPLSTRSLWFLRLAAPAGWTNWPRLRRPAVAAASPSWRSVHAAGFIGSTGLADQRDRNGFASRRHLRQEASVAAARRRAPYTRPSLALRAKRPEAAEVGYPLGRTYRGFGGGISLWPSWEASLRLVAPPGEGKTFRALLPILRQHPGPAVATSTKPDLYELSAMVRQRLGPVFALDPDLLAPAAHPARWSPVAGCERSEVAERRAARL